MKKLILISFFFFLFFGCTSDKQKAINAVEDALIKADNGIHFRWEMDKMKLTAKKKGDYYIVSLAGAESFRVKDEKVICCENGDCKVRLNKPFCRD